MDGADNGTRDNTENIRIFSTEDEKIKSFGELLTNDSSRAILQILMRDEQTASQLAQGTGLSLPLVIYHLNKMQALDVIKVSRIETNVKGQDMKYYRATKFAIVILPSTVSEKAIRSKSLIRSFKSIYRFAGIGIAGAAAWLGSASLQQPKLAPGSAPVPETGDTMADVPLVGESADVPHETSESAADDAGGPALTDVAESSPDAAPDSADSVRDETAGEYKSAPSVEDPADVPETKAAESTSAAASAPESAEHSADEFTVGDVPVGAPAADESASVSSVESADTSEPAPSAESLETKTDTVPSAEHPAAGDADAPPVESADTSESAPSAESLEPALETKAAEPAAVPDTEQPVETAGHTADLPSGEPSGILDFAWSSDGLLESTIEALAGLDLFVPTMVAVAVVGAGLLLDFTYRMRRGRAA